MLELVTPWFADLASFVRMGRHGVYVWSALSLCAGALALEWWALRQPANAQPQEGR